MTGEQKARAFLKAVHWVIALLGLWEFGDVLAFITPGFGLVPVFLLNHIATGLVLMIAGAGAALTTQGRRAKMLSWAAAGAGIWLAVSAPLLRRPASPIGLVNDLLVGVLAAGLGIWAARTAARAGD